MKERKDISKEPIATRLDNWGLCQNGRSGGAMSARETRRVSPYGGGGYQCMTNVVCTMMREAASGPRGSAFSQSKLDFEDAATINRAWLTLDVRNKLLLRDFYVLDHSPDSICRSLSIKHWPKSHWMRALAAAQEAIEEIVDNRGS